MGIERERDVGGSSSVRVLWESVYRALYEAYFQELASETLLGRWKRYDLLASLLVGVTASGSALAGLSFWSEPTWKWVWVAIAVTASVASILHTSAKVTDRVTQQEKLRHDYQKIRTGFEDLWTELRLNIDGAAARTRYENLKVSFNETQNRTDLDVAYTKRLRLNVQDELDNRMKACGYVHELDNRMKERDNEQTST